MKNHARNQSSCIVTSILAALLLPAFATGCESEVTTSAKPYACTTGGSGGGGSGGANGMGGQGGFGGDGANGMGGQGGFGGAITVCTPGALEACYTGVLATMGIGTCKAGIKTCLENGTGFGSCMGDVLPKAEICNGIDDDCNGSVDNGVLITYYADGDNDGFGSPSEMTQGCSAPAGFVANNDDCDDANPNVNPHGSEVPNNHDDNCNGELNEGVYFDSCKSILASLSDSLSGPYTIDPDGPSGNGSPFEVSCDMTSNGGGWTLLAKNSTGGSLTVALASWVDLLSQNYIFSGGFALHQDVPSGYLTNTDFFAILRAAADLKFSEVRLDDGAGTSIQNLAAPKTLRMIHAANATEPLYQGGVNTGVLLLLGNAAHAATFPCYYPTIDGLSCHEFYEGDTGDKSTAFYVGDLSRCAAGPAAGNPTAALWGSHDCYATNSGGGYGGFTFHRPFHANLGSGGYVNSGFNSGGWAIQVR